MRFRLIGLILLASVAAPAVPVLAQRDVPVDRRVDRLEQEMRAVQRRVFPGGRAQTVEPEIRPEADVIESTATGDALGNLVERVNSLESQLRTLTGQVEEQGNSQRQMEQEISRLRADLQVRIDRLEQQARPAEPAAVPPPEDEGPTTAETTEPTGTSTETSATDPAEAAYNAGYRLWAAGDFAAAATALEAVGTRYPSSRWASWARNLHGRALLDDDKPAAAARVLLANYEGNPRGERAADSLYFLGQALTRLNRRTEACRVYDELERVYPQMRDFVRTRLPQARTAARCAAA
ncbi:MAG TPA: tetratricopeptide repeat protein [Allosphingosinicella sp.]|nr:tetratricopeptide repeat protein [Allosphingosinicella sp.]